MMARILFPALIFLGVFVSCRNKEVTPEGNPPNGEVNRWIYENMKNWYYWNDKLPSVPDTSLNPAVFFGSLLYTYDKQLRPDGDRFSWIQSNADALKASLSGESKSFGMEFRILRYATGSSDVFGLVIYTLPNSPAANAGFKRGDFFTRINGQKLTTSNYSSLAYSTDAKKTFTIGKLDSNNQVVDTEVTREVTPVTIQEDPVYFDTLYTYGSKKIGYLVYNQFIPGPNNGNTSSYDEKLDNLFGNFKTKGINNLIIDFRYNPGGYVSSATNLASLIGKGVSGNVVFYKKQYNQVITPDLEKKYGKDFFAEKFKTKTQNVGNQLQNLIILVSSNTASASELVINGLRPYMNVQLVGDTTVGKNVGSVTISDDTKRIKWGMQPIVSKSFNSLNQSDYTKGFAPDVHKTEGKILYPFGNPNDPLLGEALSRIVGTPVAKTETTKVVNHPPADQEAGSSITRKAGGSNMFF